MFLEILKNDKKSESEWYHNTGTIIWYIIFLAIIPLMIRHKYSFDGLRYYFPMVDLIANVFATSGIKSKHIFKDLYKLTPNNVTSWLSTNFINLIALIGVSWNGILYAFETKDLWIGVKVTMIMYFITYLLPTQGISYFSNKAQENIDSYFNIKYTEDRIRWEGYLGGFILVLLLIVLELIVIHFYLSSLRK